MSEKAEKTLIDFADKLLNIWGCDFIESEEYKKWGMSYFEAMAQVFQWNKGAEKNIGTLKQFHNLLGLAIECLEKK